MNYPSAFCVKCKTHTETLDRHTVLLQNNSRALRGVCPKCASDVYKILPKKSEEPAKVYSLSTRMAKAFCLRCQIWTKVLNVKAVVLQNGRHALRGDCERCRGEVYKILPTEGQQQHHHHAHHEGQRAARQAPTVVNKTRRKEPPMPDIGLDTKLYIPKSQTLSYLTFGLILAATAFVSAIFAFRF